MSYRNSPLNPKARKVGKRGDGNNGSDSSGDWKELNPRSVENHPAVCPDCGSLGAYLNATDARNAENLHQQRKHGNSAHKRTISDTAQNKRNKGGK